MRYNKLILSYSIKIILFNENLDVRVLQKDNEGNLWLGTSNGVVIVTTPTEFSKKKIMKIDLN